MSIPQHISAPVFLIAGLTGSGKTSLVQWLQQHRQQAIDIETLCRHDGSVFASLQYPAQPSAYQFHKQLLAAWSAFDPAKTVFIESELKKLGKIELPDWLYRKMQAAPVVWLHCDRQLRVNRIATFIRRSNPVQFCACLERLKMKLGEDKLRQAVKYLEHAEWEQLADLLLGYYDNVAGYRYPEEKVVLRLTVVDDDMAAVAAQMTALLH